MSIDIHAKTDKEDQPLTRIDVERLLFEAGSPDKLNLSGQNMKEIDFTEITLTGANLSGANLSRADLRGVDLKDTSFDSSPNLSAADLSGVDLSRSKNGNLNGIILDYANLSGANLSGIWLINASLYEANLQKANMSETDLSWANLQKADLSGADLSGAYLGKVKLIQAILRGADLSGAYLNHANLRGADLSGADLSGTSLRGADLSNANLTGARLSEHQKGLLRGRDVKGLEGMNVETTEDVPTLYIRIIEKPLTAQNLKTIISALTELSTKYWLIAKGRFADLIEYTQTHNGRFAEEANVVVTRVTYNSPMNMDWKVDLSAPSVAEALVMTIDGITQTPKRLKQKELENQAKAQEIQHAEQQLAQAQQMALLEQAQRRLQIEQQRLEVLEKQLEVQKKGIEYALEIAGKVVDTLHPGADAATRAMEIQALLPNLVQLQNGKGLELALPVSQENQTPPKQS